MVKSPGLQVDAPGDDVGEATLREFSRGIAAFVFAGKAILPIRLSCCLLTGDARGQAAAFVKRVRSLLQRLHQLSPAVLASH